MEHKSGDISKTRKDRGSPLQISGKVAGLLVRTLDFSGHPYSGRIARSSLR